LIQRAGETQRFWKLKDVFVVFSIFVLPQSLGEPSGIFLAGGVGEMVEVRHHTGAGIGFMANGAGGGVQLRAEFPKCVVLMAPGTVALEHGPAVQNTGCNCFLIFGKTKTVIFLGPTLSF